jgi:hypothetical protein
LEAAVAGDGLTHTNGVLAVGAGTAINVNADDVDVKYDDSSIGVTGDQLYVKNGGVTNDMLAGSITDTKLASDYLYADGTRALTGDLNMNGNKIASLVAPSLGTDAVNKTYVDSLVSGLYWKDPVDYIIHYVKTDSGAPAGTGEDNEYCLNTADDTLYVYSSGWSLTTAPSADDRYLFTKTGSDTTGNSGTYTPDHKIYEYDGSAWTSISPSANWALLTRNGSLDVLEDSGWTYDDDTSAWIQFTGAGQITAGDGLKKTGNTLYVSTGTGLGIDISNDEMRVVESDLIDQTKGLTTSGGSNWGDIQVNLDDGTTGGLEFDGSGQIRVKADGITDSMINWGTGADQVDLDDVPDGTNYARLNADQVTGGDYIDASTADKGIVQFDSNHFSVTSGLASLVTDGIDETLIDWGSGSNQVDATSVPMDSGGTYNGSATNVQDALEELEAAQESTYSFKTISVAGESDVVADTTADTLTLSAGQDITITTDASGDIVAISSTGSSTLTASLGVERVGDDFRADLVANGGIKLVGNELKVEPDDFAGDGLEDDGSDNMRAAMDTTQRTSGDVANNNPLYRGSGGLNLKIDDASIKLDSSNDYRIYVDTVDGGSFS